MQWYLNESFWTTYYNLVSFLFHLSSKTFNYLIARFSFFQSIHCYSCLSTSNILISSFDCFFYILLLVFSVFHPFLNYSLYRNAKITCYRTVYGLVSSSQRTIDLFWLNHCTVNSKNVKVHNMLFQEGNFNVIYQLLYWCLIVCRQKNDFKSKSDMEN